MTEHLRESEHVGEMLSGFIDGELTQQGQQRVQLHLEDCTNCRADFAELKAVRDRIRTARLNDVDHNRWRETMEDTGVSTSRGIGWLLVIGGIILAIGVAIVEFVTSASSMPLIAKLIIGGVYGGILLLFVSVLRQRLIERKTDKYKDVEI